MSAEVLNITSGDSQSLHALLWTCDKEDAACVHICHGMAEHVARYEDLAQHLLSLGYHVLAHDQRGHGQSIQNTEDQGHYADQDGWQALIEDLGTLHQTVRERFGSNTPIILLGHSMGSFVGLEYARQRGTDIQGLVLSGSNLPQTGLLKLARFIARVEAWRQGPRGKSKLLDKLSFGAFNDAFKPNRTDFDWLSRNPLEVDKYIQDPLCGFLCSNQLWLDFLQGLIQLGEARALTTLPPDLPIYLMAGSLDPVSASSNGVVKLAHALGQADCTQVQHKIYAEGRHEMFNESNRQEVYADLGRWLRAH